MALFTASLACMAFLIKITAVFSHGRLMDPPARNSMWRLGYLNPVNYNDNELFCGGYTVHYQQNGGKCGLCGDNWADPQPRAHEANGEFSNGVIGKRYAPGEIVEMQAELTANHKGYFLVKLCVNDNSKKPISDECLDKHILPVFGTNDTFYQIPDDSPKAGTFKWLVQLPRLTCIQCVLQWTYFAGNTWGQCSNGEEAVGCGPQETFVNCADVSIISNTGYVEFSENSLPSYADEDVSKFVDRTPPSTLVTLRTHTKQICVPTSHASNFTVQQSCLRCLSHPEDCDQDSCRCIGECVAIGEFSQKQDSDLFCHQNCLRFPSNCPPDKCKCF